MRPIGLIGAGVMGLAAAKKFLEAGYPVLAYDTSVASQQKAKDLGAKVLQGLPLMAEESELALMFLPGPSQVGSCVAGKEGLLSSLPSGGIIVDMSTVDPGTTVRMAALAGEKGVGYLDAPVLGRPASVGNWALPVGGKKEDLERCRPVFEVVASKIYHIGDVGSGNKVKLLNQMMFGAINAMTAEMMAIADKIGISPSLLYETISASQAATVSNLFKELGGRISREEYGNATFTVDLLVKDVKLAVQMAKENSAPPILGRTVELINEMAQAHGLGGADTSAMWKSVRSLWTK